MNQQWSPLTRAVVVGIGLILIGAVVYAIRPLIGPLVLSFLLAYVLLPLVRRLDQRSALSYRGAVASIYLLVLLLVAAATSTIVPVVIRQALAVPAYLTIIGVELEELLSAPLLILGRSVDIGAVWVDLIELSPAALSTAAENALLVLETTSLSFVWLLIILVTTFYLLLDWDRLIRWVIRLAPAKERADIVHLLHEINALWRAYIRGIIRLMVVMAMIFIVVLLLLGMRGAVALGVLTGVLVALPEVGPIVSGLIAVFIALLQGSEFLPLSNSLFAGLVALVYFVIMQFYIIWLQPRVMGSYLKMNTGLVFVALIGAIMVEGVLTAFVIVPLLATMGVIGHYVRCKLLNLDPWPERPSSVPALTAAQSAADAPLEAQATN